MGMYTEIYVNADLKEDTPQEVLNILDLICHGHPVEGYPSRWRALFQNCSHYTPYTSVAHLTYNVITGQYSLLGKGDIKNYENEIEQFFQFIQPWCEDEFIGYYRYEEYREPTLVFKDTVFPGITQHV